MKDAFIPLLRRIHGFLMASGSGDSPAVVALTNENVHEFTPGWAGAETPPVVFDEEFFDPGDEEGEVSAPDPFEGGLQSLREKIVQMFVLYFNLRDDQISWVPGMSDDKHYLYINSTGNNLIATMTSWTDVDDADGVQQTGFGIDCHYDDDAYMRGILNGTVRANTIVDHYMFFNMSGEILQGTCTFFDRKHGEKYDIECKGVQSVGNKLCEWMCSNYVSPVTPVSANWEAEVLRSWSDELVASAGPEQDLRSFSV